MSTKNNIQSSLIRSCELLNEVLGYTLYQYEEQEKVLIKEDKKFQNQVLVWVRLGLKGDAEGDTYFVRDKQTGRLKGGATNELKTKAKKIFSKGRMDLVCEMKIQEDTQLMKSSPEKLTKSFISTLTHELLHAVGFEHIEDKVEILCPGKGGITKDLKLKESPKVRSAFIWLYDNKISSRIERLGGTPMHCWTCYEIGWSFQKCM